MRETTIRDTTDRIIGRVYLLATRGEYKGVWRWTVGAMLNSYYLPTRSGHAYSKESAINEVYLNQDANDTSARCSPLPDSIKS
jgi:hypothetical protein